MEECTILPRISELWLLVSGDSYKLSMNKIIMLMSNECFPPHRNIITLFSPTWQYLSETLSQAFPQLQLADSAVATFAVPLGERAPDGAI